VANIVKEKNMIFRYGELNGWFVLDSHWTGEPGRLPVELRGDGEWYTSDDGVHVEAQENHNPIDPDAPETVVLVLDENEAPFWTSFSECERVGMPVFPLPPDARIAWGFDQWQGGLRCGLPPAR
jgi:hypothetical protein